MDKRQWSTELGGLIVDENLTIVARVSFYEKGEISDDQELIASAPDLLETCESVLALLLEDEYAEELDISLCVDKLEIAINKAKGRHE